jgi:hypothetical protein
MLRRVETSFTWSPQIRRNPHPVRLSAQPDPPQHSTWLCPWAPPSRLWSPSSQLSLLSSSQSIELRPWFWPFLNVWRVLENIFERRVTTQCIWVSWINLSTVANTNNLRLNLQEQAKSWINSSRKSPKAARFSNGRSSDTILFLSASKSSFVIGSESQTALEPLSGLKYKFRIQNKNSNYWFFCNLNLTKINTIGWISMSRLRNR